MCPVHKHNLALLPSRVPVLDPQIKETSRYAAEPYELNVKVAEAAETDGPAAERAGTALPRAKPEMTDGQTQRVCSCLVTV